MRSSMLYVGATNCLQWGWSAVEIVMLLVGFLFTSLWLERIEKGGWGSGALGRMGSSAGGEWDSAL